MRTYKAGIAMVILTLFCSSCGMNPVSSSNTEPVASMMISPKPSEMAITQKIIVSPTPSLEVTATAGNVSPTPSSADTIVKGDSGLFNEDNFTMYFHFGMTISAVEKELKALKIEITDKTKEDTHLQLEGIQSGLWRICTEHAQFDFDQNKRLYMIVSDWETAKGFAPGDSVDKLHQLYGKEDEIGLGQFYNDSEFIYKRKSNYFSVGINDIKDEEERKNIYKLWKVFVDIYNDPHILDKGTHADHLMAGNFGSDDCIQFNEENFTADFPLGMKRQALINKLNNKRVRINGEESYFTDGDDNDSAPAGKYVGCVVCTDHISFVFDSKNRLDSISVYGWPTAKGLQRGDTEEKLTQLYGNDCYVLRNAGGSGYDDYTYVINGHTFQLQFGDYFHPQTNALVYWTIGE